MGMYDTVQAKCPKCGELIEFQSKSGECVFTNYSAKSVPAVIAVDMNGDKRLCKCGAVVQISCACKPWLEMTVTVIEESNPSSHMPMDWFGPKLTEKEILDCIAGSGENFCSACGCEWKNHRQRCEADALWQRQKE
jgi:hypothetical protein